MKDPKPNQNLLISLLLSLLLFQLPISTPAQPTFKVGLILDPQYPVGQIALTSIPIAIADFYSAYPNSTARLQLVTRNSSSNVITAASAALELITKEGVQAILGPGTSAESVFVSNLGTKANVPILAYSATSPSVSPSNSPFFIRAAPSDTIQVRAIAALVRAFGWRRVVPIYEDDDHGLSLVPYLVDALDDVEALIPYRCSFRLSASDDHISSELYRLQTLETRVFVVHACVQLAERILSIANRVGMMSQGYVWILTEGLTGLLGWIESAVGPGSTQGVLGLSSLFPVSNQLSDFKKRWTHQFLKDNPNADPTVIATELSSYAIWAYDVTWAMAMAAVRLGPVVPGPNGASNGSNDLSSLPVSTTGKKLLDLISSIEFDGLGGRFRVADGELDVTPAFRVVNVVDGKAREIGNWTEKNGLIRRPGSIVWPGESTVVPKGWDRPTSGKKLKLAVPGIVSPGFQSFLNVQKDNATNRTTASGFVIDIFEAAVSRLPYALLYDYVLVQHSPYNVLIKELANGSYDGIVADMTITAERSMFVDFTLPYKASGVSMVTPVEKDVRSKKTWVFVRPFEPKLWLVSTVFFFLTGLVVWVLEHRINYDFRGPPTNHQGNIIFFGFSTLVYSHGPVAGNLTRTLVIVWLFVVFILQNSYTASLSSMMTVQKIKPAFADFHELRKSGESVGYLQDSFTRDTLTKMGFHTSRLKPFKSPQQYEEALSKGHVAAIVDEIPYLEVFIKDYCDNYQIVDQRYQTGGFGFAFPKGSPLVADISRAIVSITEGDESDDITQKWFGDHSTCSTDDNPFTSKRLDLPSFTGLFIITGVASVLCCVLALFFLVYRNRAEFRGFCSKGWKSGFQMICDIFDRRDESSRGFRE